MAYLIAIAIALTAFFGFLLLTRYETARGTRLLGSMRSRLDEKVDRAAFIASHVDWSAFVSDLVKSVVARVAHDIAHASLITVRVIERLLTRMVKYLRSRRQEPQAQLERPRIDVMEAVTRFRKKKEDTKDETV